MRRTIRWFHYISAYIVARQIFNCGKKPSRSIFVLREGEDACLFEFESLIIGAVSKNSKNLLTQFVSRVL